jgi:hypothetical protein
MCDRHRVEKRHSINGESAERMGTTNEVNGSDGNPLDAKGTMLFNSQAKILEHFDDAPTHGQAMFKVSRRFDDLR